MTQLYRFAEINEHKSLKNMTQLYRFAEKTLTSNLLLFKMTGCILLLILLGFVTNSHACSCVEMSRKDAYNLADFGKRYGIIFYSIFSDPI
jgi:hypothetical protein